MPCCPAPPTHAASCGAALPRAPSKTPTRTLYGTRASVMPPAASFRNSLSPKRSRRLVNTTIRRVELMVCAVALAAVVLGAASNEFISTWKAPGAGEVNFTGRKVAAVLITDDDSLRVSAEEALAREISARGPLGVPAYRIIPREEVKKKDAAKGWFERAGVQGLVILRIVKTETDKVYSSVVWSSGYYGSAWDYWDYGRGRRLLRVRVGVLGLGVGERVSDRQRPRSHDADGRDDALRRVERHADLGR